ncbi:MAG: DUF4215 domain-containing protein [Kofleriaceae bacterium]|nr:DUF4215 domain-containing protein [Kofleriaceae bacterium]MCL4224570.1 DUF4215 domain-containing protein [Myxococcales bacterium]
MTLRLPAGAARAVLTALAAVAALLTSACFDSNTVECASGVICPSGFSCTADGLGCTNTACGNGVVDPGEECDDGNQDNEDDCLRTCVLNTCGDRFVDRQGPDTEFCDEGGFDTATCNFDCTEVICGDDHTNAAAGEVCDDGNNDDADGCKGDCSSDESCGNGIVDDHLPNNPTNNPTLCLSATATGTNCAEVCDRGDNISGDGCSANCLSNETCRNGIRDPLGSPGNPPEACDDGNLIDDDGCRNDCQGGAGCGNGLLDPLTEQCDDNGQNTATCDSDCTVPICGDNLVNMAAGEACDPGAVGVSSAGCNPNCTLPACGDGIVNRLFTPPGGTATEQCDDGNTTPGDGCSALCIIETCGNGITETINGEECDDGNTNDLDGCRNNCQLPRCGDGIVSASETCDTGGNSATCNFDCTTPACGDGKVNPAFTPAGGSAPEACDDGNTTAGDGCSALCRIETCGNGITEAENGEECDDGNLDDLDGCRNNCQLPFCGDGIHSTGTAEICDTGGNTASCDHDCTLPQCNDGVVNAAAGEQCEDGNLVSGDGCSSTCLLEPFTLAVVRAGSGGGTVSSTPAGISCGADCSEPYVAGTVVTLTATPAAQSTFNGWSGGGCSGTAPCVVTMSQARTVTATFELNQLTVTKDGAGTGTVSGTGIACGGDCTESYNVGAMVTLTATPAGDSVFAGWSGAGLSCPGTGTCTVTMSQARTVNATFNLQTFNLAVSRAGTGTGHVGSVPTGIDCGGTCTAGFVANTEVTLIATPTATSDFTGWSGAGVTCPGTGNCTVTMTAARAVTATFTRKQFTLTVDKVGDGTVTSSPAGINCGSDCDQLYDAGQVVTLTATPAANRAFAGWSGGGCSGTGTCVITVNAATSVTATFVENRLTLLRAGDGNGRVTSSPGGINCGNSCSALYNSGQAVTLTPDPSPGSLFTGWSGTGVNCPGTGTCVVTMTGPLTVVATFEVSRTLTVTVDTSGGATGSVTSNPVGITCPGDCTEAYADGTMVVLTATPGSGSAFTGWSGSGCSGTGTCTVTMTAARAVTATFVPSFLLTVTRDGSGTGTVTSSPGGITCGGDCTEAYNNGTVVTLTAVADAGSTFMGWSGSGCSGTGTCVVTMSAARNVTATFAQNFALAVNVVGTGTVTSAPAGINCGVDCMEAYPDGEVVTLTAAAGSGHVFTGWSGSGINCPGTGTCQVTMSQSRSVTATFAPTFTVSVGITGTGAANGSVTADVGNISCPGSCLDVYVTGTVVTLTATATGTATFTSWGIPECPTATATCQITVNQNFLINTVFTAP